MIQKVKEEKKMKIIFFTERKYFIIFILLFFKSGKANSQSNKLFLYTKDKIQKYIWKKFI